MAHLSKGSTPEGSLDLSTVQLPDFRVADFSREIAEASFISPDAKFSFKRVAAGLAVASAAVLGNLALERNAHLRSEQALASVRLPRELSRSPWGDNVTVLAASTQQGEAFVWDDYTSRLLSELRRAGGLLEAHQALEGGIGNILRGEGQVPVSSEGTSG